MTIHGDNLKCIICGRTDHEAGEDLKKNILEHIEHRHSTNDYVTDDELNAKQMLMEEDCYVNLDDEVGFETIRLKSQIYKNDAPHGKIGHDVGLCMICSSIFDEMCKVAMDLVNIKLEDDEYIKTGDQMVVCVKNKIDDHAQGELNK